MGSHIYGRWDLVVGEGSGAFPSWVELMPAGGRFVGRFGSARPIAFLEVRDDGFEWQLPKQYENRTDDLVFSGHFDGEVLRGETSGDDGETVRWVGRRAPDLVREGSPSWGAPIELIGSDLSGWQARSSDMPLNWSIVDGMLVNASKGSDLVTRAHFTDFRLEAEYRYPVDSNSGIYLRGRYEFQILDDFGQPASGGSSGAIYGFLTPETNEIYPAGEWNTADITLLGRTITVLLNGVPILEDQEIPGITGGALDGEEGKPGPIFLQGDHGPVTFRKLTLYPTER